jgi:hypothetical protein
MPNLLADQPPKLPENSATLSANPTKFRSYQVLKPSVRSEEPSVGLNSRATDR